MGFISNFSKKIGDNEYNLKAKFYGTNTEKINLPNEEATNEVIAKLDENNYVVSNITKKERNRASKPPLLHLHFNKMLVQNLIIMLSV